MSFIKYIEEKIIASPFSALIFILFLTISVYVNMFQNEFLMADYGLALNWPVIEDLDNLPLFFGPQGQPQGMDGVYLPVKTFFHAIYYHFWGLNAFGYHLFALIVHAIITILVYHMSRTLTRDNAVALLTGLFFGLHPVHSESVVSITSSVDLLGFLFLFVSFSLYLKATEDPLFLKKTFYGMSLIYGLLAVFAHDLGLALPLLLTLYHFCFTKEKIRSVNTWKRVAPYFIFVMIYIVIKWMVIGTIAEGDGYLYDQVYLNGLVMVKALAKYILICFWPFVLSSNHMISPGIFSHNPVDFDKQAYLLQSFSDGQVLSSLLVIGLSLVAAFKFFSKKPLVSFCIGWFFVSLLPVLNILPSPVFFAEQHLYIALFGFCLLLGYAISKLYQMGGKWEKVYQGAGVCVVIGLLMFYYVRTVLRTQDWRSNLTFYQKEAELNPQSALTRTNLGTVYTQYALYEQAIANFQKALELNPFDAHVFFALAEVYTETGQSAKAITALERAIDLNPEFPEAYFNLAVNHQAVNQSSQAEDYLKKALALYQSQGRFQEAEAAQQIFREFFSSF